MAAWVYLSLEIATLVLFALTVTHARRRGRAALAELLTAAVFGIVLEWGDMLLFETYHYSPTFFLNLGPVPIIIGLCWAMIIYGAMQYSDQLGIVAWAAPFADALWAILLDLAFDAVAIRLGFWTWNIPLTDGYFGVPAGNFNAWLYVALGFSAWTRWARARGNRRIVWQLLAPFAAFAILLAGIFWFDLLVWTLYPPSSGDRGMLIFVLTLVAFSVLVGWSIRRYGLHRGHGIDPLLTITRWSMHGYFVLWLLVWIVWPATRLPDMDLPPAIVLMALLLLVCELALLLPLLPDATTRRRAVLWLMSWKRTATPPRQRDV